MVARVNRALQEELGVADGLASEQVYILDPCCGTGGYLAEVLRRIDAILADSGFGALKAQMVKKAATTRVFGFEILPAPFVVAHLQVGLVLQGLGATLEADHERVGVYLTNALTGWEPATTKPLPFPELEEERKKADKVKKEAPILVIIGNPPYNGFAGGSAIAEERNLSVAYRTTKKVRRPEGHGLNDLYVRFFRMAERRIAEKTGRGIVCFISNYLWLDGLSFTGMRERYLEAFDAIFIDNLHGDRIISERAPDGRSSATIFSVRGYSPGIKVGTAIGTLIRKAPHSEQDRIFYRDFDEANADQRRASLIASLNTKTLQDGYRAFAPILALGLPFKKGAVGAGYLNWPKLPELMPVSFPGVKTSRDEFLVATDRETLERRLAIYFDASVKDDELKKVIPASMQSNKRFDAIAARGTLITRGPLPQNVVRYLYRPFDLRYLYWEPSTKLLDEKRADYFQAYIAGTMTIVTPKAQRKNWSPPLAGRFLVDINSMDGSALAIPFQTRDLFGKEGLANNVPEVIALENNGRYSDAFQTALGFHCLAVLHSPLYTEDNKGAMRADEPRVPFLLDGETFTASCGLGRDLAALLDPDTEVKGVSTAKLRPFLRTMGLPHKRNGKPLENADLCVSAGWGYFQRSKRGSTVVMPGNGLVNERDYTPAERAAMEQEAKALGMSLDGVLTLLGERTLDVHLNADTIWTNVPANVWAYTLGGYQVIKKWLSYREKEILGRALKPEEVAYVSEMVRRIAAILLLGPALDANYEAAKANAMQWKDGRPAAS